MIRDKEMDEISWRYCSYWAQGIIWAFVVPTIDINKKRNSHLRVL